MKQLAKFTIDVRDEDFLLQLTDDSGAVTELAASPEQLDALIEALDELLSDNEEQVFEVGSQAEGPGA